MISLVLRVSAPVSLILVFNAREVTALLGRPVGWVGIYRGLVAAYALLRPLLSDGFGLLWAVGATRRSACIMGMQGVVALFAVPALAVLWGAEGVGVQHGCGGWHGFLGPVRWPARLCARRLVQGIGRASRGIAGCCGRWDGCTTVGPWIMRWAILPCGVGLWRWRMGLFLGLLERRTIVEELGHLRRIMRGGAEEE